MDDRDLEQRLAGYRPVVERAMARRPLSAGGGRDRRRWGVTAVAAATVAAGVVGWIALAGNEPTSTGSVATTDAPEVSVSEVDGRTIASSDLVVCFAVNADGTIATTTDDDDDCRSVTFCANGVDGAITTGSDEGVPIEVGTIDSSGELETTQVCWLDATNPTSVAFGDSIMMGAASPLSAAGITVDALASRQFADLVSTLTDVASTGTLDAVVIHVGNSGPIDSDDLDALMDSLSDVPRVVVLTLHNANGAWLQPNNDLLRALPASHGNVVVLDWDVLAQQCVQDCFATDQFHLTEAGAEFYTELITNLLDATDTP